MKKTSRCVTGSHLEGSLKQRMVSLLWSDVIHDGYRMHGMVALSTCRHPILAGRQYMICLLVGALTSSQDPMFVGCHKSAANCVAEGCMVQCTHLMEQCFEDMTMPQNLMTRSP